VKDLSPLIAICVSSSQLVATLCLISCSHPEVNSFTLLHYAIPCRHQLMQGYLNTIWPTSLIASDNVLIRLTKRTPP